MFKVMYARLEILQISLMKTIFFPDSLVVEKLRRPLGHDDIMTGGDIFQTLCPTVCRVVRMLELVPVS